MDNGLIFPYPCVSVPDESAVLTAQNRIHATFGCAGVRGCAGPSLVVVKRWGDAGR
jgi:hypothetical protein